MVRFEQLVADPSAVIRGVCEAIGIPFEPAMLDPERFGTLRQRGSHADLADPTSTPTSASSPTPATTGAASTPRGGSPSRPAG
jgi:hypothetical protein